MCTFRKFSQQPCSVKEDSHKMHDIYYIHNFVATLIIYHSLAKKHPRAEHLTSLSKSGWTLFWVFPHFTTKQHPCRVSHNSMPSKQIIGQTIGQTITFSRATSGFKVKSWRHTTLSTAQCKHSLACDARHIPSMKIWPNVGGEHSFKGGYYWLFRETMVRTCAYLVLIHLPS